MDSVCLRACCVAFGRMGVGCDTLSRRVGFCRRNVLSSLVWLHGSSLEIGGWVESSMPFILSPLQRLASCWYNMRIYNRASSFPIPPLPSNGNAHLVLSSDLLDLLLGLLDEALDKALLILVLGVDRGQRLVGLVTAGQEESSGRESGGEGGDRELFITKSAGVLSCLFAAEDCQLRLLRAGAKGN